MSKADRQKDKYGSSSKELPVNTSNEGTAARTRPFSFEEIMLRRKNKKLTEDDKGGAVEARRISRKENGESTSNPSEGLEPKKDSVLGVTKHASKDYEKIISRTKEDGISMKNKANRDSEAKLKSKSSKERSTSDKDKGDKNEKQSHHFRGDVRSRIGFGDESERKRSKDMGLKDKHGDRKKSSQKESKRKHLGRNNEERTSEADIHVSKRQDSGKRLEADHSGRKGRVKESSQSYHEQTRPKRRRSRSWEHGRDRGRRSISSSPRAHKHTSYHGRDHGESSFRSFKDRSGRQHSDGDKNRMSGGGHGSGHHRRYGERASGLGGYSPRKRRTEAAVRTPSPPVRSPERKIAAWDLAPEDVGTISTLNNFRSSQQAMPSGTHEPVAAPTTTSSAEKPQSTPAITTMPAIKDNSVDSIQLTQATRPMRRLYIENLPAAASDKSVEKCLNDFLLSSGANHILGTRPCISCIMNKEKGQAVVEFLTPEDATAALSFDGRSFAGSILKIRRPKDFVESATGVPERPVAAVTSISDVVKDTPQKIFIGGISKVVSSDMLMEIVSVFGPLKAYRFEVNKESDDPSAFLEYMDHSITLKACAGLNGMKIGGKVLTVVQAIPDASEENIEGPFYGIPEHAKPLLEKPTQVLKLKNVFNEEELSMLGGPDLEETLEDIRLECARFGTVKSVNVIRDNEPMIASDSLQTPNSGMLHGISQNLENDSVKTSAMQEHLNNESRENGEAEPQNNIEEAKDEKVSKVKDEMEDVKVSKVKDEIEDEKVGKVIDNEPMIDLGHEENGVTEKVEREVTPEEPTMLATSEDQPACSNEDTNDIQTGETGSGNGSVPEDPKPEQDGEGHQNADTVVSDTITEMSEVVNDNGTEKICNRGTFEKGCVLVEYIRSEAACATAHCLHGRLYGNQIVAIEYVSYDLYQSRFPK